MTGMFGPILGGKAHGTYLGDYFVDKDIECTTEPKCEAKHSRESGDSILILFYLLNRIMFVIVSFDQRIRMRIILR